MVRLIVVKHMSQIHLLALKIINIKIVLIQTFFLKFNVQIKTAINSLHICQEGKIFCLSPKKKEHIEGTATTPKLCSQ